MYAHVSTYRLGTSAEVSQELDSGLLISDQTARTIASWWHSPSPNCAAITALSHGLPFDTDELFTELEREITESTHYCALALWLENLTTLLTN